MNTTSQQILRPAHVVHPVTLALREYAAATERVAALSEQIRTASTAGDQRAVRLLTAPLLAAERRAVRARAAVLNH